MMTTFNRMIFIIIIVSTTIKKENFNDTSAVKTIYQCH